MHITLKLLVPSGRKFEELCTYWKRYVSALKISVIWDFWWLF